VFAYEFNSRPCEKVLPPGPDYIACLLVEMLVFGHTLRQAMRCAAAQLIVPCMIMGPNAWTRIFVMQGPTALGEAVQVTHMKSELKAPGTKRLKLYYDDPPSNFAFKFNLRRFTWASPTSTT